MPAATMTGLRGKVYEKLSQKAVWEQSHNIFEQLDEDGSGFLDVAELQQGMERFGAKLSEKQVREMCAKIGGGDEGLNRQQLMTFLTMLLGVKIKAPPGMGGLRGAVYAQASQKAVWEQSHNIFVQLDEDGSGFLDVAELQQGMERFGAKLSEKQVREMCAKIGGGDEGLNRQQLMTFLTMLLGIKDLATPKAGLRAGVYEKYAKYFVNAIREASIGEEETTCAMQELMERRSAELAPVKPNEYKSLPGGFTRSVD